MNMDYFFRTTRTFNRTMEILRFLEAKGEKGVTFSTMVKKMGTKRMEFVNHVLIPHGYVKKVHAIKRTPTRDNYCKKYTLTPKGYDFMIELENNYKELKMKHLYGRVL